MRERCSGELLEFHAHLMSMGESFTWEELLGWAEQRSPHLCDGWERFAAITGRNGLGLCWEMQPLAEFGIECPAAIGLYLVAHEVVTEAGAGLDHWLGRMRHAFPYLCAPIVHAEEYLEPAGDNPRHVGFWQGSHYAWALQQKQCWAGWP